MTDPTLPPQDARPEITAAAEGVQIYHCAPQGAKYVWIFDAPEATLFDAATHATLGKHFAGPRWTWTDGSSIQGVVLQKSPSPDGVSVPWLLLQTHSIGTAGRLASIRYVRRHATEGGAAPPAGCDAQHNGAVTRVPYKATYTFYTSRND